jgi:hypothetical protein
MRREERIARREEQGMRLAEPFARLEGPVRFFDN